MPKNQSSVNQTADSQVSDSQSKILKNLSHRLTDDYFNRKNFPLRSENPDGDGGLEDINAFIKKSSRRISGQTDQDSDQSDSALPVGEPDPPQFNGISGTDEERTMILEQMKHLERENLKLKHQFDLLQTDYQTEKRTLSGTIRDLKTELHRTAPLTENKFFTFSKDLRAVVSAVNSLSDAEINDPPPEVSGTDPVIATPLELPAPPPTGEQVMPKEVVKAVDDSLTPPPASEGGSQPPAKPKLSKKVKTGITAAAVVAMVTFSIAMTMLNRQPAVDPAGSVQGTTTDSPKPEASAPPIRKEFKNNEVSFDDTQWEVFRDEFLGFQVRYPGNATDLLATANTITFLRLDGYLFKMQRIQTDKTLDEYWTKIKADGLQYKVEPVKQGPFDSLHLILQETIDYPGNRYLVKVNDHIIDVWYATPNAKYNDDDMKRVDYMVQSMRFL